MVFEKSLFEVCSEQLIPQWRDREWSQVRILERSIIFCSHAILFLWYSGNRKEVFRFKQNKTLLSQWKLRVQGKSKVRKTKSEIENRVFRWKTVSYYSWWIGWACRPLPHPHLQHRQGQGRTAPPTPSPPLPPHVSWIFPWGKQPSGSVGRWGSSSVQGWVSSMGRESSVSSAR